MKSNRDYLKMWSSIKNIVGTPFYFYDVNTLRSRISDFRNIFRSQRIFFSAKSQNNRHIISLIGQCGLGVDAVSSGEVHKAIISGIDPAKIAIAGVGKTKQDLEYCVNENIGYIIVESFGELSRLNTIAERCTSNFPEIILRLNIDVQTPGTHKKTSTGHSDTKFGIALDQINDLSASQFSNIWSKICGIHFHLGSPVLEPTTYKEAILKACTAKDILKELGLDVSILDIGGGFATPNSFKNRLSESEYRQYLDAIAKLCDSTVEDGYFDEVFLEPGRAISESFGFLVSEIQYIKEYGGGELVIVDAGMNDLVRPALYDARHEILHPYERSGTAEFSVAGPICESSDFFGTNFLLNDPRQGDLIGLCNVGAYGSSMSSRYNARPLCPEIALDGDDLFVIREREPLESMYRFENQHKIGSIKGS